MSRLFFARGRAKPSPMGRFARTLWSRLALALFMLGLALSGFGHRHHNPAPEIDPQLAAYLALGGSLHDLCLSDDAQGQDAPESQLAECPACTLGKAMALSLAALGPSGPVECGRAQPSFAATPVPAAPTPHLSEARAPPAPQLT